MPYFKCDACGHKYSDIHTMSSCPVCMGQGKIDPRCICVCYHAAFSMKRLNIIKEKNPQCPVHGNAITQPH